MTGSVGRFDVRPFRDEYPALASLDGTTPAELQRIDEVRATSRPRWLAWAGDEPVAAVTALARPDARIFLSFAGTVTPDAIAALADAVVAAVPGRCCVAVDDDDHELREALADAGFVTEIEVDVFRVGFDRALASLGRTRTPPGVRLVDADRVAEDALFALDTTLRNDVPGTDGWRGDRDWFRAELEESPPFEPAAYQVAVREATGDHLGLARVWRNPGEPRFGLIGVKRRARRTLVAPALVHAVLTAAAEWGSPTFVTETATTNDAIHPRLLRLGADRLGRSRQMVRRV